MPLRLSSLVIIVKALTCNRSEKNHYHVSNLWSLWNSANDICQFCCDHSFIQLAEKIYYDKPRSELNRQKTSRCLMVLLTLQPRRFPVQVVSCKRTSCLRTVDVKCSETEIVFFFIRVTPYAGTNLICPPQQLKNQVKLRAKLQLCQWRVDSFPSGNNAVTIKDKGLGLNLAKCLCAILFMTTDVDCNSGSFCPRNNLDFFN